MSKQLSRLFSKSLYFRDDGGELQSSTKLNSTDGYLQNLFESGLIIPLSLKKKRFVVCCPICQKVEGLKEQIVVCTNHDLLFEQI